MKQETKILYLTLKAKFYDMIDAGIKTEEYRELKKFWGNRLLVRIPTPHGGYLSPWKDIEMGDYSFEGWSHFVSQNYIFKDFTHVHFARGGHFGSSIPQMRWELKEIIIGTGKEYWGAEPGKEYFVIKLGEKINL